MNLSFLFLNVSRLLPVLTALLFCAGCVPRSDYEELQKENQELQKSIDQVNAQLRQAMVQLQAAQLELAKGVELQARLQELQRQLKEKEDEMMQLETRWEKFKGDRRKAMVGQKFPQLALQDGRVLKDAEITGLLDDQLAIRHESGFLKVELAMSSDDLRWLACFDPADEKDSLRLARLARSRDRDKQLEAERRNAASADASSGVPRLKTNAEEAAIMRKVIEAQRTALNTEYNRLLAQNRDALGGANWNSSRPEDSGLINVFAQRRAVMGLGALESLAAAIKVNLRKLHDLETP